MALAPEFLRNATRGVMTIEDLRARSTFDPSTMCWHWTGALSNGQPRIHTLDHARSEKLTLSGPRAVWNIAHGRSPGQKLVYRTCMCADCVNPAHHALALNRDEIWSRIVAAGIWKGATDARLANLSKAREAAGIVSTPDAVVLAIRAADKTMTNRALAEQFDLLPQVVSRIRRGQSHRHLLPANGVIVEAA